MDINDFRGFYTIIVFAVFIGIVLWAWSGKSKRRFNEAAQLPFNETEHPQEKNIKEANHE